ncbi:MAG: laccase domain-containing protein [Clostridia bacterium]|nr:laccase domain-containing protein [Clostridia bacterium]
MQNSIPYLTSPLFEKYGIPHAFTTRRGGCSEGAFDSLNVSTRRKDSDGCTDIYENTVENFRRVLSLVGGTTEKSVCAHQVHGNTVLELSDEHGGMGILRGAKINIDGDGLFAAPTCGIEAICVKSADCTPILFADRRLGSVCAVHSGWRGTVLDIAGKAVETMVKNGSRREDILCAVGPCIGVCCYEVSEDVYLEVEKTLTSKNAKKLLPELFINKRDTENGRKYDFNIGKMCAELAILAGLPRENTDFLDICTCCSTDSDGRIFFSHRGQHGHSGTFASVIAPFRV